MKVFLLGRPGSGKSSVARIIEMLANDDRWLTYHISDYKLLQDLFLEEQKLCIPCEEKLFRPTGPEYLNGFDVVDFSVLDTVLNKMEIRTKELDTAPEMVNRLFLLEFARADYHHAFQQFSDAFLQSAYFLYLKADMDQCISRIYQRVANPITLNDHFVSNEIMKDYYCQDDWPFVSCKLIQNNNGQYIHEINNSGSTNALIKLIKSFASIILKKDRKHEETSEKIHTYPTITTGPLELDREELMEALAR